MSSKVEEMWDEVAGDLNDVGCSYTSSRGLWKCLVWQSLLLSEGKKIYELDDIEELNSLADHLPPGFINKGNRSPRRKKVIFVPFLSDHQSLDDASARTGKKLGHELIGKTNLGIISDVDCHQEPVSKKITIKMPSSENLDKNPHKRTMNSEEDIEVTSKKRAKKSSVVTDPTPDLPEVFKNRILDCGGYLGSEVLVIQKELTRTDLSRGHGRLSLPYKKVRNEFLKPSEADELEREKAGIHTTLIQPCLQDCEINLRNWKSNTEYVLVRDWNKVCSGNELREGMMIQLWSFRRNSSDQLCFALVKVD